MKPAAVVNEFDTLLLLNIALLFPVKRTKIVQLIGSGSGFEMKVKSHENDVTWEWYAIWNADVSDELPHLKKHDFSILTWDP